MARTWNDAEELGSRVDEIEYLGYEEQEESL